MALSINIALDSTCAAGGHAFVSVSADGGAARLATFTTDSLVAPLTAAEKEKFIELAIRAKVAGMTKLQARTALQSGFTVTL